MPSPDFSEYVDLTEFDVQPSTLYNNAVAYARTALPELEVRPGTIEDALIQAGAYVGAAAMGAINRLPDQLMEGLLRVLGVNRNESTAASVDVEFTLFSPGDTVEENTVYVYDYFDGTQTLQFAFQLEEPVTAATGSTTVSATLKCLTSGPIPSFSVGTQLVPNAPSTVVFTCETTDEIVQGLASESDSDFLNRATTYLQSLSATLNTARQIENYILRAYSNVTRVKVYDLAKATELRADLSASTNAGHSGDFVQITTSSAFYASASAHPGTTYRVITPQFYGNSLHFMRSGTFTVADNSLAINPSTFVMEYVDGNTVTASAPPCDVVMLDPLLLSYMDNNEIAGHFVVFVCGDGGIPVGRNVRSQIEADLAERIPAGLKLTVLDAWTYDLDFTLTVGVSPGFSGTSVGEAVKQAVESLVSPDSWPEFNDVVRVYEIVAAASNVEGVDFVSEINSVVPTYPNAFSGNQNLVQTIITGGSQITGYRALYAGMLPRASVEVITL